MVEVIRASPPPWDLPHSEGSVNLLMGGPAMKKVALLFTLALPAFSQIYFDDSSTNAFALGNGAWELVLSKTNGGVLALTDKSAGGSLTLGSRNGCLWGASFKFPGPNPAYMGGCSYSASGSNRFTYSWDGVILNLQYTSALANATVTIIPSDGPYFDMSLVIQNQFGDSMGQALFPSELLFRIDEVQAGYLPMQLPGVRLNPAFFAGKRSFGTNYPGNFAFADYLALDVSAGRLAIYTVNPAGPIQPVTLGLMDDSASNPGAFKSYHAFQTAIPSGATYTSPVVRVRVGQSPQETITAYRNENGIADYPNVADKLGANFDAVARSPLVKTDFARINEPFAAAAKGLDGLASPALIHPVAYWAPAFDRHYPDFLPTDPRWGSTDDFNAFITAAHARGFFVMPYTNPTWWDPQSPTVQNLPAPFTLQDVAALDQNGNPIFESYGPNSGFAASPSAPFVQQRVGQLMSQWRDQVPVDFVFQDQIGARPWKRDYNPAGPDPVQFSQEWLNLAQTYSSQQLMTEDGWDRLAQWEIGFNGSSMTGATSHDTTQQLWGASSNGNRVFGMGNWSPYPLALWLMHDKVLFYQHDLDQGNFVYTREVLTWNAAFGVMNSFEWPRADLDPAWRDLAFKFQRTVAYRTAGRLLSDFIYLVPDVTLSRFGDITIVANWNPGNPYVVDDYTISPSGCLVRDSDGSLLAGVLSDDTGDHYVVANQ